MNVLVRRGAVAVSIALALCPVARPARADPEPVPRKSAAVLRELDGALSELVTRVSPAVVQVQTSGYGPVGEAGPLESPPVARLHGLGSGVIVDPAGYVLTNYHVVHGAQRIVVVLPDPSRSPATRPDAARRRTLEAQLIGADRVVDLALLKVKTAEPLPSMRLEGPGAVRQGELVFAIGSPQGLASTVTMGVVSSIARESMSDAPMAFIQTDAPINPGNSGGALVNGEGELVGINTFILSQSGGSQGLGFAIPSPIARIVYDSLRKFGRVRRVEIGITTQPVTPTLAEGLKLSRDWGLAVSDVVPDGPAAAAGVKPGDIVQAVDDRPVDGVASLLTSLYLHVLSDPIRLVLLRGSKQVALAVQPVEAKRPVEDLADLATPDKHLVRRLGILALTVDATLAGLVQLREGTGVVVAARTLDGTSVDSGLQTGDVIHAVNNAPIASLEALREAIRATRPGQPVVLRVERQGGFHFLAFDME